jgi:predicted O-methyltransferase YrrM
MIMKTDKFPKWFHDNNTITDFENGLEELKGKKNLKFLQIGVFTGNASAWLLENILTDPSSILVDVDPWCGNLRHESIYDWSEVEAAYDEQVKPHGKKVHKHKAFSQEWLKEHRDSVYDFIYIDGDHVPEAVTSDADLSWDLLQIGGIMAFDDYEWDHPDGTDKNPKPAIDKFLKEHKDEIEILRMGWQVWIRKTNANI